MLDWPHLINDTEPDDDDDGVSSEGRASVERNQERVDRIQQLREELRGEEDRLKGANRKTDQAGEHNSSPVSHFNRRGS